MGEWFRTKQFLIVHCCGCYLDPNLGRQSMENKSLKKVNAKKGPCSEKSSF